MKIKPELLFESHLTEETQLVEFVTEMKAAVGTNSVLLLSGELASGKTTVTKVLCELYALQSVQSPTYAIHQRYQNQLITIDHFDLYRIQNADDLISTGFWDLLRDQKSLVVIEWFEKIQDDSWLEQEIRKRNLFGLKIEVSELSRHFRFFKFV